MQQTFLGYAMAQLKQIKTHRSWLLNPPKSKPLREDFGLPIAVGTLGRDDQNRIEQSIADKIRSYGIDDVDMPKPARVSVHERMDAFVRDVLGADEAEVSDRMRAVAAHALQIPSGVMAVLNAEKKIPRRDEALGGVPDLEASAKSYTRRARSSARVRYQARDAPRATDAHGGRVARNG